MKEARNVAKSEVLDLKEKFAKLDAHRKILEQEHIKMKHAQQVANQIQEWKSVVEQSAKMADQMKSLVCKLEIEGTENKNCPID